jgi:hypothetical protein
MYREGKANARADALSRIENDVREQDKVMAEQRTQVLLPRDKIDSRVVEDLQLAPLEQLTDLEQLVIPAEAPVVQGTENVTASPEITVPASSSDTYDSIRLVERILQENRTSPELNDLRIKAQVKAEDTWQLKDGLLFRYSKLYVTDGFIALDMPLQMALIREAHDQPLSGHLGH